MTNSALHQSEAGQGGDGGLALPETSGGSEGAATQEATTAGVTSHVLQWGEITSWNYNYDKLEIIGGEMGGRWGAETSS